LNGIEEPPIRAVSEIQCWSESLFKVFAPCRSLRLEVRERITQFPKLLWLIGAENPAALKMPRGRLTRVPFDFESACGEASAAHPRGGATVKREYELK
jgi:hypothetical protein